MFRSPRLISNALSRGALPQSSSSKPCAPSSIYNVHLPHAPIRNFTRAARAPLTEEELASRRKRRGWIYAGVFGISGYLLGKWAYSNLFGPELDAAGEAKEISRLRWLMGKLRVVQKLRADPDYVERDAYDNFAEEEKPHRLTSGPMSGFSKISLQRVFWNEKEHKVVNVVFFGPGLSGWPFVVHGGALATILDETLGRVAILSFPARTGVTANLQIKYRKPVMAGEFCTVTAEIDHEKSTERKAFVKGELRDSSGNLCTEAEALFVVPKNLTLRTLGDNF
ncbi:hypothetical protein AJ79_02970 [Helicocarpus griseus UAMH5409]|uniref:Thioesterase domain-containing protein n=1 Tax=Helicocarpus griseus UAMH5409 TaxID=1447875 RepID=A0A2B7Y0B9_9EURO|nr:hypothetical protein AJ79_02970 [Helicocarpus griseus UAMH5409]